MEEDVKEKIELDCHDAAEVVWGDHPDWSEVPGTVNTTDHSRWTVGYEGVFKHKPTGKFYMFEWEVGATESQDYGPEEMFCYEKKYSPTEVAQVEKLVKVWEPVK